MNMMILNQHLNLIIQRPHLHVVVGHLLVFSWPEKIVGYLILGYMGYVLVCMILGTFDIL